MKFRPGTNEGDVSFVRRHSAAFTPGPEICLEVLQVEKLPEGEKRHVSASRRAGEEEKNEEAEERVWSIQAVVGGCQPVVRLEGVGVFLRP